MNSLQEKIAQLLHLRERLSRPSESQAAKEELQKVRPEDLAEQVVHIEPEHAAEILQEMEPIQAANVLVEAPTETVRAIVRELPDDVLAAYLDVLPMDDAMDLREELGDDRFESLLNVIPKEDAQEIRRLMAYPEDSVGRLMTERFFWVKPEATVKEILADIRIAPDEKYEMVNDLYVLDENEHVIGVTSLRKVLRVPTTTTAAALMKGDVVTVRASEDEESAARLMARYGFYALPVVDDRGKMVGIFTGDDAQAILREAETEDVLAVGAVSGDAEPYMSLSVWQLYKRRFPWLLALFVAETLTGQVMRHYFPSDGAAATAASMMLFLPLILGAGGNSGSQVTTTITRALALGEVVPGDWLRVIRREFATALLVGGSLGLIGFARALFGWNTGMGLSLVVGLALPAIVLWATSVGSLLPIAAKRLKIDPAVMSAPFITTFVDATGLIIYFEIALRILPKS